MSISAHRWLPLDPRHRLVTTKYNPARTSTAENSVGIGGAYLCVYGMEGPGGYQFVGRTLQMWSRYHEVADFAGKPRLLRFSTSCVSIRSRRRNCWRFAAISRSDDTRCALSTVRYGWRSTSSFSLARRRALAHFATFSSGRLTPSASAGSPAAVPISTVRRARQKRRARRRCSRGAGVESPVSGNLWQVQTAVGRRTCRRCAGGA